MSTCRENRGTESSRNLATSSVLLKQVFSKWREQTYRILCWGLIFSIPIASNHCLFKISSAGNLLKETSCIILSHNFTLIVGAKCRGPEFDFQIGPCHSVRKVLVAFWKVQTAISFPLTVWGLHEGLQTWDYVNVYFTCS